MPEVARAKWNSGAAITDPVREQHLLKELIREGERQGLSAAETTMFFTAQMAGAKRLQEDCFRRWQAEKRGRFHRVADLKQEIRPAIDRLNRELLQSWAAWRCHPAAKKLRLSHLERISQQYLIGPGLTEQIRQKVLAPLRFEASR
jgi:chorismate mutase